MLKSIMTHCPEQLFAKMVTKKHAFDEIFYVLSLCEVTNGDIMYNGKKVGSYVNNRGWFNPTAYKKILEEHPYDPQRYVY